MSTAYFDADGVCRAVSDVPMRKPRGGAAVSVPVGTTPALVWWDGTQVQAPAPCDLAIPAAIEVGSDFALPLPASVVAIVNGKRQRGTLTVRGSHPGYYYYIDIRGAQHGSFTMEVRGYVAARRADYPSIADQLDAFWKGGAEAEAMRARVTSVKARWPKP